MNLLENSPLEVQAFNYLSFGFLTLLNNLWTWLAVSFWKIRSPESQLLAYSDDPVPEASEPEPACVPTVVGNGAVNVDGVTKGKFTLYYEVDREECDSDEEMLLTEEWEEREGRWEGWESWERLLKMRIGENENGWYTCQDLTALDGNVVRFWDGESRNTSRCVHVW